MTDDEIARRLGEIAGEPDPSDRSLKVALLVGEAFKDEGHDMVLVGGSAIEYYTEGRYVSGDIDICSRVAEIAPSKTVEIMERLGKVVQGRHFEVAGCFVEILGLIESHARTEFVILANDAGTDVLYIDMVEELLAERIYRAAEEKRPKDIDCARKLLTACVKGSVDVDWGEVRRLLRSALYRSEPVLDSMLSQVREELELEL